MLKEILKPYKAFVFDFDLTLADGSEWIVACFQTVLRKNGYANVTDEACRRTIGMTLENAFTVLTGETDFDTVHAYRLQYSSVCRPQMAAHTRFYPEALQLLEALRKEDKKLAIVSTKMAAVIEQTLCRYGLEDWFEVIVGVLEVSAHKPDPSGLEQAMQRMNVLPQETLYFGDNIIDAQTAVNAGVDYMGVTTGVHTTDELSAYPHVGVVCNLTQLLD